MKIAVFTLTRDRLYYTKLSFESLRQNSGIPFLHCVVDNGSVDGTKHWLRSNYRPHLLLDLPRNVGISVGCNLALQAIRQFGDVDLIVKFDNDCLVTTERIFPRLQPGIDAIRRMTPCFVCSPRVYGIVNQPARTSEIRLGGLRFGHTSIVGGLFQCVPARVYAVYRYPEILPVASGQDDHFCSWIKRSSGTCGYFEDLQVEHIESTAGQARRYPAYFVRKHLEERTRSSYKPKLNF